MKQYLDLLQHVMEHGTEKSDRTGTGTRSVFGWQMRFDLNQGFPLVTTKKLHLRSIIHELLWFLKGETNIAYLKDNKVNILGFQKLGYSRIIRNKFGIVFSSDNLSCNRIVFCSFKCISVWI